MSENPYSWAEGYWKVIYATAKWCDADDASQCRYNLFVDWIKMTIDSMPCAKCRRHGHQYIYENPPRDAFSYTEWVKEYQADVDRIKN
jgi:hypothetical protein